MPAVHCTKLWYLCIFSEVRLVEILDGVCRHSDYDVSTILASYMHVYVHYLSCDQSYDLHSQCHRILENNEEELEIWWFKL